MKKATLEQLVEKVMEKGEFETKKASREALDAVFGAVVELFKEGYDVPMPGIGTLKHKERNERLARHPQTGEPIVVPAKKTAALKPSKDLESVAS